MMKADIVQDAPQAFRPLKKKLLFAIIIVSTVLTSIVVFFHFKFEYGKDLSSLVEKIQQISDSSAQAMSQAAWNEDHSYLQVQVDSIAKLEDIIRVRVTDSTGLLSTESYHNKKQFREKSEDYRTYKFPLNYKSNADDTPEFLGNVEVTATIGNIKMDIYNRLAFFIVAQFLKTFLISWLILIICHHYINKNLEQIIEFVQAFNLNSIEENYLKIKRKTKTRDEISVLQDSINRMIKKIHHLNLEKENKITEQEKKIELQTASAINSSKMAALGEMAGGIAHEINNPLTVIHTKTRIMEKMIERGIPDNDLFLKNTQSILGTVDRISNVIQGLKNISKDASTEERQDAVIKGIIDNVLNLCEEKFKNHNVELFFDPKAPIYESHLNCYPIQLSQVFLILLNNSFDAIEDRAQKWIKIEAAQNKKWMFMHFIDSGDGVPKEIREKIFQPFYTTKEIGKGTGLGLSLAFEIIKKHGGEIFYDDHYKNTCFTIKLLLKERKFILVVDDDIDIREAICSYLQLEGYRTVEASSGKEALKIIRDQEIEFVVSDIRMPDGGGLFLVDELRKIDRLLPYVILVTGQADITREEAIKRGALDLLKKPLEMDRIIGLIKYIENSYNEFVEM
ncbi:MAG: response regulator [Bacteriovorax sp.]|nr:response regulator [Bacteriovorax sp.]